MNRPEQDAVAERGVQQSSSVSDELRKDVDMNGYANARAELSKQGTADGALSQLQITGDREQSTAQAKCVRDWPPSDSPVKPRPSGDGLATPPPSTIYIEPQPRLDLQKTRDPNEDTSKCRGLGSAAPRESQQAPGDSARSPQDSRVANENRDTEKVKDGEVSQKITAEQAEQRDKERTTSLLQVKTALSQLNEAARTAFLKIPGEGKNLFTQNHVDFLRNNHGTKAAAAMQRYIQLTRTDYFE